jgi:hypothetical protein
MEKQLVCHERLNSCPFKAAFFMQFLQGRLFLCNFYKGDFLCEIFKSAVKKDAKSHFH